MNTKFYSLTNRGGQILFCVTLAFVTMLSSCSTDDANQTNLKPETSEERIERRLAELEALGKTLKVEHATLEEINLIMRQGGLPEFSKEEVEASLQTRSIYPCAAWVLHGDWNQNGAFTAGDLFLARQYLCTSMVGCNGQLNITQGSHPNVAVDFAFLSHLGGNPNESHLLTNADITYARNLILGIIPCN